MGRELVVLGGLCFFEVGWYMDGEFWRVKKKNRKVKGSMDLGWDLLFN